MGTVAINKRSTLREVIKARADALSSGWSKGTQEVYDANLVVVMRFWNVDRPVGEYSRDDVLFLVKKMKEYGNRNVTIKARLGWLHAIFKWAMADELITVSPVCMERLPPMPDELVDRRPFTFGEFLRVTRQAERFIAMEYEMWLGACTVAYYTGMRMGDCAQLRWEKNGEDSGTWVELEQEIIVAYPMKRHAVNQRLEIPMEPELCEYLQNALPNRRPGRPWVNPFFFWKYTNQRRHLCESFSNLCQECGLPYHSFHSFRHGFVTRLMNVGVDPITIGAMTGQSIEQIKHYAHISHDAKKNALSRCRAALHKGRLQELEILAVNQTPT